MIIGRIFQTLVPETPALTEPKSAATAQTVPLVRSSLLSDIQANGPVRTSVQEMLRPLNWLGTTYLERAYEPMFRMIDGFLDLAERQERDGNVEGACLSYELAIRVVGDELLKLEPWQPARLGMDWTLQQHRILTVGMIGLCWKYGDFCEMYGEYEQADLGYEVFRRKMSVLRNLARTSDDETVRSNYDGILEAQSAEYLDRIKRKRYEWASHLVPLEPAFLPPTDGEWNPMVIREILLDQAAKLYARDGGQESRDSLDRVRRRFAALRAAKDTV